MSHPLSKFVIVVKNCSISKTVYTRLSFLFLLPLPESLGTRLAKDLLCTIQGQRCQLVTKNKLAWGVPKINSCIEDYVTVHHMIEPCISSTDGVIHLDPINNAASLEQGMARHTYAYRVFIRNLDPFKFPYPSPQVTRTLEPLYSGHHWRTKKFVFKEGRSYLSGECSKVAFIEGGSLRQGWPL